MWVDNKIGKKSARFTTLEKKRDHIDHLWVYFCIAYTNVKTISPGFNNHRPEIAMADQASFRASLSRVLFRARCEFSFAYSVQVLV